MSSSIEAQLPFNPRNSPQLNSNIQPLGIDQTPLTVSPKALLKDVVVQMGQSSLKSGLAEETSQPTQRRSSYALVISKYKLLGIVTERDIVKLTAKGVSFESMTVQKVMTTNVITLKTSEILDAFTPLNLMRQYQIRHLPILDELDHIYGVITSEKLRESLPASALLKRRMVKEVMTEKLITATPTTPVLKIAQLMFEHRISCVVIQESEAHPPQGIITEYDILKIQRLELNINTLVAESIMSCPLECLHPDEQLWVVQQKMKDLHVRRLVVVNNQDLLIGLVTQSSILSVIDPQEMSSTIEMLQHQIEQLQDERIKLLQDRNETLKTQMQTSENSLLIYQEKFRSTFEQAAVGIAHVNLAGKFIAINRRFGEILGYPPADLLQQSFIELTYPDDQAIGIDAFKQLCQGAQTSFSLEKRYIRQDGSILWGNVTVSIATDPSGEPAYFIAVLEDIYDRKQAEIALQQFNHELEARVTQRTSELQSSEQRYRMLFESAPDLLFVLNMKGEIQQVNSVASQRLGYTAEELEGHLLCDFLVTNVHMKFDRFLDTVTPFQEMELLCRDQQKLSVECACNVIEGPIDQDPYILVIQRDITDRKLLENKLRSSEQQIRILLESMNDVVLIFQIQEDQIAGINLAPTTPQAPEETLAEIYDQTLNFIWENTQKIEEECIHSIMVTRKTMKYEYSLLINGERLFYLANLSKASNNSVLWVAREITHLKQVERELYKEKELAQVTLQSIGDAVITTDTQGNIDKLNPVAEFLTGWNTSEIQGRPLSEVFNIVHEDTRQPIENPIQQALKQGQIVGLATHTLLIARNNQEYAIEDSAAPIRNREGQVIGAVMVFHDVTQARNLTRQLSWQASHDPMTQLINRRKFDQILCNALLMAKEEYHQHALCYLDLDEFKLINDTCGHPAGDQVLCQIATLFHQSIRTNDVIARLGGDEFAILLHQCPLDRAIIIAEKLRRAVQEYRFDYKNKTFRLGVSIGLVVVDQHSPDFDQILGAADAACYAAKNKGKNRIQVFGVNDSELIQHRGEQWWSIHIKQAIEDDRLYLYQQSIVPTVEKMNEKGKICELLLRMIDEQGKVITAGEFIPAAERYHLMSEIDRWVVGKFLSDFRSHQLASHNPSIDSNQYMINLSGASVGDEKFLEFLKVKLEQHPTAAQHICFEITETVAISNLRQAVCFIEDLKLLGCQFALDDFGSGMASFTYLKTLPVDYLKIDGHFIEGILDDPANLAIVESINHIGHVMGIKTIAEFVSNQKILKKLQSIGMDYVQGFAISHPNPLVESR